MTRRLAIKKKLYWDTKFGKMGYQAGGLQKIGQIKKKGVNLLKRLKNFIERQSFFFWGWPTWFFKNGTHYVFLEMRNFMGFTWMGEIFGLKTNLKKRLPGGSLNKMNEKIKLKRIFLIHIL
jgi:hypothetical protein